MCRYGMSTYKPHYACFNCRKTFKRRLLKDIQGGYSKDDIETLAKCPDCSEMMADMGLDFEAPKKNNNKAWEHMALLYKVAITFHSCGCSGPGYIPRNPKELIEHFKRIKETYIEHQSFWARRHGDPESQSEIAKDRHKNARFIYSLPIESRKGTKNKPQYDASNAQKFWQQRILEIEAKINTVTKSELYS